MDDIERRHGAGLARPTPAATSTNVTEQADELDAAHHHADRHHHHDVDHHDRARGTDRHRRPAR